jgi:phage baseplate assembly protein W
MRYKFLGYSTIGNISLPKILHDRDIAQQDLLNEIYTRKGERVMSPTFGCIAWDILFDPFTNSSEEEIKKDLARIVAKDPRWENNSIKVRESQEQGIDAEVSLTYVPTTEPVTLNIKFDENATVEF